MTFANGADITGDYQFELSDDSARTGATFLFGAGQNNVYLDFQKTPPTNLFGYSDVKSQDVTLYGQDGAYANPDYLNTKQITLPVMVKNLATESDLVVAMNALQAVWTPKTADWQLAYQWPELGVQWYTGRPRGAQVDISLQRRGIIRLLLRFDALNPVPIGD